MFKQYTPLGFNQCAACKKQGHWKSECPENKEAVVTQSQQIPPEADLLMMEGDSEWRPGVENDIFPAEPLVPVKLEDDVVDF